MACWKLSRALEPEARSLHSSADALAKNANVLTTIEIERNRERIEENIEKGSFLIQKYLVFPILKFMTEGEPVVVVH